MARLQDIARTYVESHLSVVVPGHWQQVIGVPGLRRRGRGPAEGAGAVEDEEVSIPAGRVALQDAG